MSRKPKFHADDGSERIKAIRAEFEQHYVCSAFNFEANPIGSEQCDQQWRGWLAAWNRRAAHVVTKEMAVRGEAARVRYMENVAADRVGSMVAALTAALGDGDAAPPQEDCGHILDAESDKRSN